MSRRSGDRFSRRGGGGSRQDEIGRTIHERVVALMDNRWKYLTPFDMFKDIKQEVYRFAMTEAEWQAWQTLEWNPAFRKAMNYTDRIWIRNTEAKFTVMVQLPEATRVINVPVNWGALPPDTQDSLHNWVIRSEAYRWEGNIIKDRVAKLTRLCSTPGQIERVWPELMGFMPGHVIDTRLGKKVKSPYPDGVWEDGWELLHPSERKLKEKYRPEVLEWFNDALAEALILPLQEWSKIPYPEISTV